MNLSPDVEILFQEMVQLIHINFSTNSSNDNRQEAIKKLNNVIQLEEPSHSLNRSLQLAQLFIQQTIPNSDPLVEYAVYYGLQLLTQIVRHRWKALAQEHREGIGSFCVQCCQTSTVQNRDGATVKLALHSPLILNSLTQLIWELFCRTYPIQWSTFLEDTVQNISILGPAIFLNISEMINDLILPKNPSRRKELIIYLQNDCNVIFAYFARILSSEGTSSIAIKLKAIQTLESLFQWFILDKAAIKTLLDFYYERFREANFERSRHSPNSSNSNSFEIIQACYQCFLGILKRQNVNRLDDILALESLFYTLDNDSLTSHLVQRVLPLYFHNPFISTDSYLQKLFLISLEISVEILTHCLELYNQKIDNQASFLAFTENQELWKFWAEIVVMLLDKNNALLDEILLKFLLFYGRCKASPLKDGENSCFTKDKIENNKNDLYTPIAENINNIFLTEILKKIALFKNEPQLEESVQEKEMSCAYFDEYESYLDLFRLNRVKFINFIISVCDNNPKVARIYLLELMGIMLGPYMEYERTQIVPNWNCFLFMLQTLLPRLEFDEKQIKLLEWHFERLLTEADNPSHDIDSLTNILSCLSAMSTLYRHFCSSLIQVLLETIFRFALKSEQKLSLHASHLFIRLSLERAPILIDHFDWLCTNSDELFLSKKISHSQYFSLIEGLLILSNHFTEPSKQQKFISSVLQKIDWIRNYEYGENGIKFAEDSLLNSSDVCRDPISGEMILSKTFLNFKGALRLLTIIFKRLNPKICVFPEMLTLFDFVMPFYLLISHLNYYWKLWREKNITELTKYIHQSRYEAFFDEMPHKMYSNMLQDRKFLFQDRDTLLRITKEFEAAGKPVEGLNKIYCLFLTNKYQAFFLDLMALASSVFNYLFVFYQELLPEQRCFVENFMKSFMKDLRNSFTQLPLIYCYDLLLLLLNFATHIPREDALLNCPEILDFLNENIIMLFEKLHPWFDGYKPDVGDDNVLEIIIESLYTIFSNKFVSVLFSCQTSESGLRNWIQKFDKHSEIEEFDRENMDLVEAMKDCSILSEGNDKNSEKSLLNSMISRNWKVAEIILKLLKWPVQREKICAINRHMIQFIIQQGILNSVDKITSLFTNILEAISITEVSESSVLNQLVKLFAKLYEKVALTGYSVPFNLQLSTVTGVDVHEWNRYASLLGSESSNSKTDNSRLKTLRKLLESLCKRPISQQHIFEKPNIEALFKGSGIQHNKQKIELDIDSSIAALFGNSS